MTPRTWADKLRKAGRHLALAEPSFARLIARIGPCRLQVASDPFEATVRAVVAQQISTVAARTIFGRLVATLPDGITAESLLSLPDESLRLAGFSRAKIRTVRALSTAVCEGIVNPAGWSQLTDDGVTAELLPVVGIGPWTVQMVQLFSLGRLDIWPVGDLGVQLGVQDLLRLTAKPTAAELARIGEPWGPYRSVAAWYLWRSRPNQ